MWYAIFLSFLLPEVSGDCWEFLGCLQWEPMRRRRYAASQCNLQQPESMKHHVAGGQGNGG